MVRASKTELNWLINQARFINAVNQMLSFRYAHAVSGLPEVNELDDKSALDLMSLMGVIRRIRWLCL